MSRDDDEDEEETASGARGRPNAWFAEHGADNFGGGFRGTRPAPHGGSITVSPDDTAGSLDLCWCGLPFNHDWPGKALGRKHPREEPIMMQPDESAPQRIERRILRAYHEDLIDLIMKAINEYGVKYRLTNSSVILFPPDGTPPYAVHRRNGDRQRKAAQTWFVRHCVPLEKITSAKPPRKRAAKKSQPEVIDPQVIQQLAETVNSEEHMVQRSKPRKATTKPDPVPEPVVEEPVAEEPVAADFAGVQGVQPSDVAAAEEWVPYLKAKSQEVHPDFLINEATGKVKCKRCGAILAGRTSTAGHLRTHHSDTSTLWGPEAKAKAIETYHNTKLGRKVEEAVAMLQEAMGVAPQSAEIQAVTKERDKLLDRVAELEIQVKGLEKQVDDMNAKAALAREALGL